MKRRRDFAHVTERPFRFTASRSCHMMSPLICNVFGGTMRTRSTAAALAGLLLATLTACSGDGNSGTAANPSTSPSASSKTYTFEDCKDLIEYDLQEGQVQNASGDPECSHLSKDEYDRAAVEVLKANKEEILQQAGREAIWDEAWDEQPPDEQDAICAQIEQDGVDAVGAYLKSGGAQPAGHEVEMAQYYLDNKC